MLVNKKPILELSIVVTVQFMKGSGEILRQSKITK